MISAPAVSRRGASLLGIAGILLIAATLRLPVGALSPLAEQIALDIPLSAAALGVLGMMPPIGFALSGLVAPLVARRLGLETTLLLAVIVMILGHVSRALASDYLVLVLGSFIVLLGAGFGNVLMPSAVKRFAPFAIGPMTAAYAMIMAAGSAVPPTFAVPLGEAVDWRFSLASWAILVTAALVPWLLLAVRAARARARDRLSEPDAGIPEPGPHRFVTLARSRTVWGITIPFTISSISAYVTFALLPVILQDVAGVTASEAGSLLAVFAISGLPLAFVAPVLTARLPRPTVILVASMLLFLLGYGGLLLAPQPLVFVWVLSIGLGQVTFPMCLTLMSMRTQSAQSAASVSGFVQTVGYAVAAVAPLALGALHEITGSWAPSLIVLLVTIALTVVAIPMLGARGVVEEEL